MSSLDFEIDLDTGCFVNHTRGDWHGMDRDGAIVLVVSAYTIAIMCGIVLLSCCCYWFEEVDDRNHKNGYSRV
jgi:hypothetical protein